jgi:glycosyltransferase involved in cell wall biosynthesis
MLEGLPEISIIIPTYNEERNISVCLNAILKQNYLQEKCEIIIVDNRSLDRTVEIVREYQKRYKNISLIFNDIEKHGETSKKIGFRVSRGMYFVYLDADIELCDKDWLGNLMRPHLEHAELAGAFGRFWPKKEDTAIGRYLRYHSLELDPVFQFFCIDIKKTIIKQCEGYSLCEFIPGRIPPVGICLYKKKYLDDVLINEARFMDIDVPVKLSKNGYKSFAYVEKAKIYHTNIKSLKELLEKRARNIHKIFLPNMESREFKYFDLTSKRDILRIIFWFIYANLFFPAFIRGVLAVIKYRDLALMYEPVVTIVLTDAIIIEFLKSKKGRIVIITSLKKALS